MNIDQPCTQRPPLPMYVCAMTLSVSRPAFPEGPYVVDGPCVLVEADGNVYQAAHVSQDFSALGPLFATSPDLYDHTEALALLAQQADSISLDELRRTLKERAQYARVSLARATGLIG